MKLSYNWLKEYVNMPKKLAPEEIGAGLTLHTVEVEGVEKEADKFASVIVGKILEIKKHPNADRLQVAQVNTGKEIREIVCGAPNIAVGQLVPVALPGASLPNGMEIKEAEVRGVKSAGMLCAPDELGLGDDHSGILILDKKAKVGEALSKYLKLEDIIFEVDNKSLSNRPDLWNHYGMAREISAIFSLKLKPLAEILANTLESLMAKSEQKLEIKVKVEDQTLCPRYMALAMEGVKVGESPEWMKKRLSAAGMRPINNIVDITNFVMLELGQPMHAFDTAKIKINKDLGINVRLAKEAEKMETLDGEERKLEKNSLVIADSEKALAVAGVMGGAGSEISAETTAIVLESANFNPVSVRKTAGKLGLRTESSIRFEKSLDPNSCEWALIRAVGLIKEVCPQAKVISNLADEKNFNLAQGPLELDLNWIAKKIGEKLPSREIVKILEKLGFVLEHIGHKLKVTIPSWRATRDINTGEDIIEEIIRIYGYDKLAPQMPKVELGYPEANVMRLLEKKLKNLLIGAPAMVEAYNYSFVSEDQLLKLNLDSSSTVRLVNPIASNQSLLRPSLIPNLLLNVKVNQAKFDSFGLFEIGSIFLAFPGNIAKGGEDGTLPFQEKRLGIILAGSANEDLFAKTKGIAEYILAALALPVEFKVMEEKAGWADLKKSAKVSSRGVNLGMVAKLDAEIARHQGLKKEIVFLEVNLKDLLELVRGSGTKYSPVEKFPPVMRDLAFVIDAKILYNDIRNEIANFDALIRTVELFDVYEGDKIGHGKRSLAFHIIYQGEKTLTAEEVDGIQQRLIKGLEEKFGAKVRDF